MLSIQPYDIVLDVWNAEVHMTVGSLLSARPSNYGRDLITAMNTIQNKDLQVNEIEPIKTTAMKMKLRVKDKIIVATPDTGAAMLIISDSLAKELGLPILPISPIKVQALNNITTMIGVVDEPPLKIQQTVVPIILRVVKSTKPILLLGMDWHTKHAVITNIGNNTLDFTAQGQ